MIYTKRWHGIKGETIGDGTKYAMQVVRVQTEKDGPWQSLNDKELEQLLSDHNKLMYDNGEALMPKKLPTTKVIEKAQARKPKKKAKKK